AMRPLVLNGIDELARRQDLVDRSLVVTLPSIPDTQRRPEERLFNEFRDARPHLLGAICEAVSTALRNRDSVSTTSLPRMADFAQWVIAAETALPWKPGEFITTYASSLKNALEVAVEGDAVAISIPKLLNGTNPWRGTATKLLGELDPFVSDSEKRSRQWPTN